MHLVSKGEQEFEHVWTSINSHPLSILSCPWRSTLVLVYRHGCKLPPWNSHFRRKFLEGRPMANHAPKQFHQIISVGNCSVAMGSIWWLPLQVLRQCLGASVWDDFFDAEGKPKKIQSEFDPPVTSNKVRGPLSAQAKKIGSHAYYLIDHIFFDPVFFELEAHAFEPKQFRSPADALEEVQPSLLNPSDHYPVIADLIFKAGGAKFCRTCWDASSCAEFGAKQPDQREQTLEKNVEFLENCIWITRTCQH